ncbi:hypothetical protein PsYK624_105300 [Phanerochaete sordida]|uniref:RNI-like protein n=1 Tax=Phanerochaete sordida TaxID=48140 RepID=A0A9P3LGA2_9APHY|nr:hypothetical protein PsYK624_105300 [Phanerochaete sordida]
MWTATPDDTVTFVDGPLLSSDRQRFDTYAKKVKILDLKECADPPKETSELLARLLATLHPEQRVLSNLQELHMHSFPSLGRNDQDSQAYLIYVSTLLGAGVTSFTAAPPSAACTVLTLSYLRFLCPAVQDLCIIKPDCDIALMLSGFRGLTKLNLTAAISDTATALSSSLLQSLGALPNLRHLSTTLAFDTSTYQVQPRACTYFPSLESLKIGNALDLSPVGALLCDIASQTPKLISVTIDYTSTAASLPSARSTQLRYLTRGLSMYSSSLVTLTLACNGRPSTAEDLQCLSSLTKLRSVTLVDLIPSDTVTDLFFGNLTRTCSVLQVFTYLSRTSGSPSTLAALGILASNCPQLWAVSLPFNVSSIPPVMETGPPLPRRMSPVHLLIHRLAFIAESQHPAIAEYISAIYPNVNINFLKDVDTSLRRSWESVIPWIALFERVRRIERQRVSKLSKTEGEHK